MRFAFGGDGSGGRLVVGAAGPGAPRVVPPVVQLVWPSTQTPDAVVRANVREWVREAADRGWQVQVWTPPPGFEATAPGVTATDPGATHTGTGWAGTGAVVRSWDSLAQPPVIQGPGSVGTVTDVVRLSVLAGEGGISVGVDAPPSAVSLPVEPLRVGTGAGSVPYLSPGSNAALPAQIGADPVAIRQSVRDALTGPVSLQVIAAPPNSQFIRDVLTDVGARLSTPDPTMLAAHPVTDAVDTVLRRYTEGGGHAFDPNLVHQIQPGHALTDATRLVPQAGAVRGVSPVDPPALPVEGRLVASAPFLRDQTPAAHDALAEARRLEPLPVNAQPSHRLRRLEDWINQVQLSTADSLTLSPVDCVVRALGAFTAMHGRVANITEDITEDLAAPAQPEVLATAFNGRFTAAPDPEALLAQIGSQPGAMTLIHVRPPNRPAHVFWLVADIDQNGNVTPRWVDTQANGLFTTPASANDSRARQMRLPGTRVLHLDANGRPGQHGAPELAAATRTLDALLDPSHDNRRAGALPPGPPAEPVELAELAEPAGAPLNVPGDGLCQIYSVITSDPAQVSTVLARSGRGSDELHEWLRDPAAVRREVAGLLGVTERDRRNLLPGRYRLREVAEELRGLVLDQVLTGGPANVPVQALQAYRQNDFQAAIDLADDLDSEALRNDLRAWGITSIENGDWLPVRVLRNAYLVARTDELAAQNGGNRALARATAVGEVPLRPAVAGSNDQNLAANARSPRYMFDYLSDQLVRFDLADQSVETLRAQHVEASLDGRRPPNTTEFAELVAAVENWETAYREHIGEAFLPLLASFLEMRIQIHQPGRDPVPYGRAGGWTIDVHRFGDHYNASVPTDRPRPEASSSGRPAATPQRAADPADPAPPPLESNPATSANAVPGPAPDREPPEASRAPTPETGPADAPIEPAPATDEPGPDVPAETGPEPSPVAATVDGVSETSATSGAVTQDVESGPGETRPAPERLVSVDSLTPRERQIWQDTHFTPAEQASIAPDQVPRSLRRRRMMIIGKRRHELIETERSLQVARDALNAAPEGQFGTVAERQEHINRALEQARHRWNRERRVPPRPAEPTPVADQLAEVREALGQDELRGTMYLVGSPLDVRTARQVYLNLAMDRVDHPRIALTDDQHHEWDRIDAEAALKRVSILAPAERRLAARVAAGTAETPAPEPGGAPPAAVPPPDSLSDREWRAMRAGSLQQRRRMELTITPEQHQRAGRHELHARHAEITRLSKVLEDVGETDPVPESRRRRRFDPIEPMAPGRPLPRRTRPGRQLFRTVLATGRRELVTLAAHDKHHWPTGGRRLGVAADRDVDPVSTSEAPEMPVGFNPKTNTDTTNVEEVEPAIEYEYYTVDRTTGLSTKEVLDPRERIHEIKPLGGYEPGAYAHRRGQLVPVGEPKARVLTYDEGTGLWDVVAMDTRHVPSPRYRDADGRPVSSVEPAPATGTAYQILRRNADGGIDLLTYRRAPEVAPGPDGPGGIYHYQRLDGTVAGWHAGTIPGFPTSTVPLAGAVTGQTSVALVRDSGSGLWRPVPTETSDSDPSESPAPRASAPRTFHRLNEATGNLEDLPIRASQLDVLELELDTGTITPATFAASVATDTGRLALDPLNNLVVPPAPERGSLWFDPKTHEIRLRQSDDPGGPSGDGGGTFGDHYRPGGGDRWGTVRRNRRGGAGSRVVTRGVTTTFTRITDSPASRPAGDIPTSADDDAGTPGPRQAAGRRTTRSSRTGTGAPPRVNRTVSIKTLPRRLGKPLAGVLDPDQARTAVDSFNRVLVTHRGVERDSLPRLSRTMAALRRQLNRTLAGGGPAAGRALADDALSRATPAGTRTPATDPLPLAWGRSDSQPLSDEAIAVLDQRGLHAVAADESGGVLGTVLSSGVLHRVPGMRALTASEATVTPDSIAGMLLADRTRGGWPLLGLSTVDPATDRSVAEWIVAGLPADGVPEPVRLGLARDGQPRTGAEVLVHLTATLAGRPVEVVWSDGSQVRYGPDSTEPPMVLVADGTGTLLATVPRDSVPAVLAAESAQVLRPGAPNDPTTVWDDERSLDELGHVLATITGVENLPLPGAKEWATRLRTRLVGDESVEAPGDAPERADAGLDDTLAAVRDALSGQDRTPPPIGWPGLVHQPGDPNVLDRAQESLLRDRGLAAVWTQPGSNALFEAVRLTGQHGPARLGNIGEVSAASLRLAFSTVIRAELGRRDRSPLTAVERSDQAAGRDAVLDFAARLATPTGGLYPETPHLLGRTMSAVFGVSVEIIGPDGTPHLYEAAGQAAGQQPLTLVMDANGHVMATVPVTAHPGTVRVPGPPPVKSDNRAGHGDPVPSGNSEASGDDLSDRDPSGGHASDRASTTSRGWFEHLADPGSSGPDDGEPGAGGQPPLEPVLPPLVLPPAGSNVHSIGIPRGTLPYVDELEERVQAAAVALGRPIPGRELKELGQRLLDNYRQVAGGGHLVTLDGVELLITMAPSDPRFVPNPAGSYDLVAPGPARDDEAGRETAAQGRFRSNQVTHGSFNTGGVSQSHTGQGTSLRGRLAIGQAFGVGPGVLQVGKLGAVISGTANESSWATSQFKDAESGRVEDDRADSTLIAYHPNWTVQIRRDPGLAWGDVPPVWQSQGAEQDPLLLYVPDHYLGDPGPQVTAENPGPGAVGEAEFRDNQTRLPDTYFASGLTGLPELYDSIINQVQAGGVSMPLNSPMRDELRQRLWKLDSNLGAAINEEEGYRITLHDKDGKAAAVVQLRTSRIGEATRAGTTSNVSHLERVRTAIVGQSASHGLKNESNAQLSGGVDLVPLTDLGLGLSASLGWTWTNNDTTNAGRTGLWVLVSRYSGHTGGYTMPLRHQATVSTVARPDDPPVLAGTVDGTALVRLPEPAAHSHGLPVDTRAVDGAQPDQEWIPYRPGATRDTGGPRTTGGVLPSHVYEGRGIGMGLARVDDDAVAELRTRVVTELREQGFLPPDPNRPFHQPPAISDPVLQNMQLANLNTVMKFVSGDGLDSHFDQSLQDGLPFTLTVREPDGKLRSARITIKGHQNLVEDAAAPTPAPGPGTDPEKSPNSRYYQRRTGEYHLVNLAIGTGSGGTRTGGGRKYAAGGRATASRGLLKGLGGGMEFQRSIGASQGVGFVVNRPELLEYPGDVDEFVLPTDYVATIQYDDVTPTRRTDPVRADVTVHLLPALNTGIADPGPAASRRQDTPRRVIDQAVIYHLDTTGLVAAARTLQPELTGVGATNDEEVNNFASQIMQRSFLKEALGGQLQTNQLFESGLLADRHGALGVSASMGASTFIGATKDQFTLGLIKLWLAQASHSATRGDGLTWDQADLALHGDPGIPLLTDITAEVDRSVHKGVNSGQSMSRTGGKELLELSFHQVYGFATTVDFNVEGIRERGGKLVPTQVQHGAVAVNGKTMVYLLAEPEALAAYAAGDVPISLAQLQDALNRWQNGELTLSNNRVKEVLRRLTNDHKPMDADLLAWVGGIAETVGEKHRDALKAALIKAGLDTSDDTLDGSLDESLEKLSANLWFAPYLTRTGPRALGHSGVHDFTFDDDSNMFDLVHAAVEEAAPGLLGVRQQDWAQRVRENEAQVWYRKTVPGGRSMIGRVPGGLDFLQSIMSGGREQAMFEDMLGEHGVSFYLVNPIADTLADVVEVNLQMVLTSTPKVRDFVLGTGLENYGHAYADQTTTTSQDSTRTWTLPKVGLSGANRTSGGPELHFADGHHSGVNQTTQNVEEQTAYDWSGEYRFDNNTELRLTVTRLDMVNRPVNNTLTRGYRNAAGHAEPVEVRRTGKLVLRVPRGLAEAQPQQGPDPVVDMSPLPRLPGDSYITAALVDDALPAAEALLSRVLGPVADDPRFRSSISLPVLLSRSHLTNHLTKALAGREYLVVDHMFIPGHSSDRVSMWLSGNLYNLRVLAPIVNATGTGRYAKHQSGTNVFSNHDRMRPSLVGGLDQGVRTHLNDPANPSKPWAADVFDASTAASRVAPRGVNDAATDNYRNETHVKQQGEVFLVQANVQLRLRAERTTYDPLFPTRHHGREESDLISGTVFLELFADEVVEMQERMAAVNAAAVAPDDPATWPRANRQSPRFRLDRLLIEASRETGDVRRAAGEAAARIQPLLTQPGPIVLTSQPGRRAYEAYTAVLEWAHEHLAEVDPVMAAQISAEQQREPERLWELYRARPASPVDVAQTWAKIWYLARKVNAGHDKSVALPPEVASAELDVVHAARQVARQLNRHVQLEDVDHTGSPKVHRIDPNGRVYRLNIAGEALWATDAYGILRNELERASAYEPNGDPVVDSRRWAHQRLDDGRVRAGIDDVALERLYRNSWSRGQTFEQAIWDAIAAHDREQEEATAPVELAPPPAPPPPPPSPSADSDTHSIPSHRPRPRDGSFASDRREVLAQMASIKLRHAGHRPDEGTVDPDSESDEKSPSPDAARLPQPSVGSAGPPEWGADLAGSDGAHPYETGFAEPSISDAPEPEPEPEPEPQPEPQPEAQPQPGPRPGEWRRRADGSYYEDQGLTTLPGDLERRQASGEGNLCLVDSLSQLLRHHNFVMSRADLRRHLERSLPPDSAGRRDIDGRAELDVYDPNIYRVLFTAFPFRFRLQVLERTVDGEVLVHPVRGLRGPIFHVVRTVVRPAVIRQGRVVQEEVGHFDPLMPTGTAPANATPLGYLSHRWLTMGTPVRGLNADTLPEPEQTAALEVARLPLERQATAVREHLVANLPDHRVTEPTSLLDPPHEPGTLIWFATDGWAGGARVRPHNAYLVFAPRDAGPGAAGSPDEPVVRTMWWGEFTEWLGTQDYRFVVATPAIPTRTVSVPDSATAGGVGQSPPFRFGYLARRWLSGDVPSGDLSEADLSADEREEAARVSTQPLEAQAALAREHLARALPSAHVSEPVDTIPAVQSAGTRIWLAADNGVARAVYVESTGEYRLFDPSSGVTVDVILAWDFPARVGDQRHLYVVAVPAEPTVAGPQST